MARRVSIGDYKASRMLFADDPPRLSFTNVDFQHALDRFAVTMLRRG